MRRRSSRFPVWVRCTYVQKYYLEFVNLLGYFSSYLVRGMHLALVWLFLVSFLCSRVGCRGVPAVALLCLFSSCWFGYGPWGPLAFCACFSSASVFPSGSRLRQVTSCILFDFPFSLDVELIRVDLLSWRCGEVFQILDPQL